MTEPVGRITEYFVAGRMCLETVEGSITRLLLDWKWTDNQTKINNLTLTQVAWHATILGQLSYLSKDPERGGWTYLRV